MFTIPKTLHAAVYRGPRDVRIETVPMPVSGRANCSSKSPPAR
jgi:hypothetical protein